LRAAPDSDTSILGGSTQGSRSDLSLSNNYSPTLSLHIVALSQQIHHVHPCPRLFFGDALEVLKECNMILRQCTRREALQKIKILLLVSSCAIMVWCDKWCDSEESQDNMWLLSVKAAKQLQV
jgi:hypothetical protein